jgi:hypothetical protein
MPDWWLESPAIGEDFQGLVWRFSVPEMQQVSTQIPSCNCRFPDSSPIIKGKKVKTILFQAWTGPEGSRRFRLPDFKAVGTWRW